MPKKILIVEDNTELLELLRLGLKDAGFTAITASNGTEALKKARGTPPDLIVLDLVLPELDGFAVCEILRKDPATAATPIILLTGLAGEFSRYAGLESGANEHMAKPASTDHLVSRIRFWLEQPSAAQRPAVPSEAAPRRSSPGQSGSQKKIYTIEKNIS